MDAYRADDATVKATTLVRLTVVRNANRPIFLNRNLQNSISEDKTLGEPITVVIASDADSVSLFFLC